MHEVLHDVGSLNQGHANENQVEQTGSGKLHKQKFRLDDD
jgi:hypothetical protein